MGFTSLSFLFLFLPLAALIFFLIKPKFANCWLLLASLFYYGLIAPGCLPLLLAVTAAAYLVGLGNQKIHSAAGRRILLAVGIGALIALLVCLRSDRLLTAAGQGIPRLFTAAGKAIAPIGASFYILQAVIYMADTYRGEASIANPIDLALYISFFPKLISGPLLRTRAFREGCAPARRTPTLASLAGGVWRLALGLCKKVLIANQLGLLANTVFDAGGARGLSVLHTWLGVAAYSLQLYIDFSGYSDMAVGIGALFGYELPENFRYPYAAASLKEFWRRWHISLSAFFRDYVYIPLGGSRSGKGRWAFSLMLVWLLTGLWHGFSWNYVIWGLAHGLLLMAETLLTAKRADRGKRPGFGHGFTLLAVMLLWCVFRAKDLPAAGSILLRLIGVGASSLADEAFLFQLKNNALVLALGVVCCIPPQAMRVDVWREKRWYSIVSTAALTVGVIASVAYMFMSSYHPFLYSMF